MNLLFWRKRPNRLHEANTRWETAKALYSARERARDTRGQHDALGPLVDAQTARLRVEMGRASA